MERFAQTISAGFAGRRVVILGDLVADQFLNGTISRVSREAPVFILRHDETETRPGGAANAAANVASLGGSPILIGAVGTDSAGRSLMEALGLAAIDTSRIVTGRELSTTTKVRVLAGQHYAPRQQVIRIDYENRGEIGSELASELKKNLAEAAETADAIVISDYNYGIVSEALYKDAHDLAADRRIPLIADSRFGLERFYGATAATPNQEEVEAAIGKNFSDDDCDRLREQLGYEALLVTMGNKGMRLFERGCEHLSLEAVGSKQPVDVTGAGDTVIAAYALGLAAGMSHADAALAANHAGGIVVMKRGTASASADELIESLSAAGDPRTRNVGAVN